MLLVLGETTERIEQLEELFLNNFDFDQEGVKPKEFPGGESVILINMSNIRQTMLYIPIYNHPLVKKLTIDVAQNTYTVQFKDHIGGHFYGDGSQVINFLNHMVQKDPLLGYSLTWDQMVELYALLELHGYLSHSDMRQIFGPNESGTKKPLGFLKQIHERGQLLFLVAWLYNYSASITRTSIPNPWPSYNTPIESYSEQHMACKLILKPCMHLKRFINEQIYEQEMKLPDGTTRFEEVKIIITWAKLKPENRNKVLDFFFKLEDQAIKALASSDF